MQDVLSPGIRHTVYARKDGYLVKIELSSPPLDIGDIERYHDHLASRGYEPAAIEELSAASPGDSSGADDPLPAQLNLGPEAWSESQARAVFEGHRPLDLQLPPQTIICAKHLVVAELRTATDGSGDRWYSHAVKGERKKWCRTNF